jgi:hypothetical protein
MDSGRRHARNEPLAVDAGMAGRMAGRTGSCDQEAMITINADRYIQLLQAEANLKALLIAVNQLLPDEPDPPADGHTGHITLFCHGLRRQRQRLRRDLLAAVAAGREVMNSPNPNTPH